MPWSARPFGRRRPGRWALRARCGPISCATKSWPRSSPRARANIPIASPWSSASAASPMREVDAARGRHRPRARPARHRARATSSGCGCARGADLLDRPDRHRQVRRRLAALRRRRAGRPHRRLPRRRRGQAACSPAPALGRARRRVGCPVLTAGELDRRAPTARRVDPRARGPDAGSSGLPDLHLRLDRHAEGHRHHATATSATSCAPRTRSTASRADDVVLPGRLGRLRPVDGGDLDSLSRRRDAVRRDARR